MAKNKEPQFFNENGENITEKVQGKKIYSDSWEAYQEAEKKRTYHFSVYGTSQKVKHNTLGWVRKGVNHIGYVIAK